MTYSLPSRIPELPALIAHAGEKAAWRFVEFFTVAIRKTTGLYDRRNDDVSLDEGERITI